MKSHHHGYLLVGDTERALEKALDMSAEILEVSKEDLNSNPDFYFFDVEKFTIDDARKIKENSAKKSFYGKGRVFAIKTNFFTGEAGNALLKTFEEPLGGSHFFVVTGNSENVLSTLRSRLFLLNFEKDFTLPEEKRIFCKDFFVAGGDDRMDLVKKIISNKEEVINFLSDAEMFLAEKMKNDFNHEVIVSLEEVLSQKINLSQRASSPKMIMEYLCLVLPQI